MAEPMVHFQPHGRKVGPKKGRTLLEHAHEAGVAIESVCGSAGKCGKCKVIVRSGSTYLSPPSGVESKTLEPRSLEAGFRLACQTKVISGGKVVVEVPQESQRGHHRLLAAGVERKVELDPAMRKFLLTIPPATMEDLRADDDRLLETLREKIRSGPAISPGVHRHISGALRDGKWLATASLFRGIEVVRVEPGDTIEDLYGVAVDIGTTKVVAYLIDLNTGETLGTESMPNPQIPYGEDVIARITYTRAHADGVLQLQKVIVDGLNTLISRLCAGTGIDSDDILEVMVVGNTAMHHIFFGIPAHHLAAAPYTPAVRTSLSMYSSQSGLDIYPFGRVSSLPNIAGFVGADAVSALVSSGLYRDKAIGMTIDIGTNTEITAGNKDRLVSCSCASGPAFEGAHIRFGMRAATGAIERVWIDSMDGEVNTVVIDDAPPRGICGSGIVDAVSQLFLAGLVDASGKLALSSGNPRVRRNGQGVPEFVLVRASETESREDITITQHDIQEIQLAKAAIFTGVATVMRKLKLRCQDIRRIYAAGAFGTYVDASSAISIGMYPDVPVDRIKFIGNAAGSGARMALRSVAVRDLAEELSRKVEYIELAAEKDFQTEFAKAMFLPHRESERFPSVRKAMQG